MKSSNSLFFGYCAFTSLFLLISGVMSYQQNGSVLVLVVLLPVVSYFFYYIARLVMKKEALPSGPESNTVNKIIFIILVAFVSGSLYSIWAGPTENAVLTKSQWVHSTPAVQEPAGLLGTIKTEGGAHVRIREKPTVESAIVEKAKNGQTFDVLENTEEWVRVQLEASQSGWINKEFITVSEKK